MKLRIVLLLACVAACMPPRGVQVADTFTPEQHADIERAVTQWNSILLRPIVLGGDGYRLVRETPPDYVTRGWSGETVHTTRVVYIAPDVRAFYPLVLHELGHVAGLHDIREDGVMNHVARATVFSADDLEECRAGGACSLSPIDLAKCQAQGACP